jgi:hypothetical protein
VPANVCNLPFYKKNYFKGEINVWSKIFKRTWVD